MSPRPHHVVNMMERVKPFERPVAGLPFTPPRLPREGGEPVFTQTLAPHVLSPSPEKPICKGKDCASLRPSGIGTGARLTADLNSVHGSTLFHGLYNRTQERGGLLF